MKTIKAVVFTGVLFMMSFGCSLNKTTSNSTYFSNGSNNQSETVPDFSVTAEQISDEYKANKQSTNEKYVGKTIEIRGEIDKIDEQTFVTLYFLTFAPHVVCLVQDNEFEEAKVKSFDNVDSVTVIGIAINNKEGGAFYIDECRIK